MIQGSTYRIRYKLPFNADKAKDIKVVFTQDDREVLTKHNKEITKAINVIVTFIAAEESKKFKDRMAYAQIIAEMQAGGTWVSKPFKIPVFDLKSEGN